MEIVRGAAGRSANRVADRKMAGGGRSSAHTRAPANAVADAASKEVNKKIVIKQELMHQIFYR